MDVGIGHGAATLESRFADLDHPVLLTGIQALLRLLIEQHRLDRALHPHRQVPALDHGTTDP